MESVKYEAIYSQTGTSNRPTGMQPVGIFPDTIKGIYSDGHSEIIVQIKAGSRSSQHIIKLLVDEAIETIITNKNWDRVK